MTLAGALYSGKSLWWSFAGALFALIVVSVLWAWLGVNWLRIRRRTLTRVAQAGQTLTEEFIVSNLASIPKLFVEIRDFSNLPGHYASRVVGLIGANKWRGWKTSTFCAWRGRYTLGPIKVRSGDPLGVYQMERSIDRINNILVYPAIWPFGDFPLPAGHLPGGTALRRRTHYVTTNAAGVRDYINGDVINRIHWPLSVKRQRLTVKEFELDPMSEIWIILDLDRNAQARVPALIGADGEPVEVIASASGAFVLPARTEEYAVSMAASVAQHFLKLNKEIGLICYNHHREVMPCERGVRQTNKLMEMLAVLQADGAVSFDRVLRAEGALLPRGATLVAISSSPDVAWAMSAQQLMRSGQRVVAIVIDSETFGGSQSSRPLVAALIESGAVVRIVRRGDSLSDAIDHAV